MNQEKEDKFRIIAVTYLDFLGFSEMVRKDLGKLVIIKGDNELGKTSFIKGIRAALKKADKKTDFELIMTGRPAAQVMMSLQNLSTLKTVEISRTITNETNNLKLVEDGRPVGTAQTRLNEIVGESGLHFNPIDFFLQDKSTRRNLILKAISFHLTPEMVSGPLIESGADASLVDFSRFNFQKHGLILLGEIRDYVYDIRREQGRKVDQLEKSINQDKAEIPETFDVQKYNCSISSKLDVLRKMEMIVSNHEKMIAQKEHHNSEIEKNQKAQDDIKKEIVRLDAKFAELENQNNFLIDQIQLINEELLNYVEPNISGVQAEIQEHEKAQKLINKIEAISKREAELIPEREKHQALDLICKLLAGDIPRKILSEIKLPIEGLSVEGDNVFLNGVAIDQLSTEQQINFSVQLARALAGPLKAICVDRIESLSNKNYQIFLKCCAEDDFQYFITRVTDDTELIIENGD
jgi:hypothetical protein